MHADFDHYDTVSRDLPLATAGGHERRWALSLQAYLTANGVPDVVEESPDDMIVGNMRIPTTDREAHVIRIRYSPVEIPRVSIAELDADPTHAAQFAGKTVFVGETAQAGGDRVRTPYSNDRPAFGVEIHANAYETLARHTFLVDAPLTAVLLSCLTLAAIAGLIYAAGSGWPANVGAAAISGPGQFAGDPGVCVCALRGLAVAARHADRRVRHRGGRSMAAS